MLTLLNLFRRKPKAKRFRSSITGKFVSAAYAKANPDTTVGESA